MRSKTMKRIARQRMRKVGSLVPRPMKLKGVERKLPAKEQSASENN
jgi:hypothetical protein